MAFVTLGDGKRLEWARSSYHGRPRGRARRRSTSFQSRIQAMERCTRSQLSARSSDPSVVYYRPIRLEIHRSLSFKGSMSHKRLLCRAVARLANACKEMFAMPFSILERWLRDSPVTLERSCRVQPKAFRAVRTRSPSFKFPLDEDFCLPRSASSS